MRDRGTQSSRAKQSVLLNKSIHEILRDSDKLKKKEKRNYQFRSRILLVSNDLH
jgi:hypothetical protein